MGSFRTTSSTVNYLLEGLYADPVRSRDSSRPRVRFASHVAQFEIPRRQPNSHGPELSPMAPGFDYDSCGTNSAVSYVPMPQRMPLGVRDQNINRGAPSSTVLGSPAFNPTPSPLLPSGSVKFSTYPPSCCSPLPFQVQRRGPSSPEELPFGCHGSHYVGSPLQGPRIPVPHLPISPQSSPQIPQATEPLPQNAPMPRRRTSSSAAPAYAPVVPQAAAGPQRHSWPQDSRRVPGDMVHYLLKGDLLLSWDIRQEPRWASIASEGGLLLSNGHGRRYCFDLSERAICRGLIQVEVDLSNLRLRDLQQSWGPIVVRSTPSEGVSMGDLLNAIYCHFHQRLTRQELLKITAHSDLSQQLKEQYADRYYLNGLTGVDDFRRSDILEGLTKFRFLDVEFTREDCFAILRLRS